MSGITWRTNRLYVSSTPSLTSIDSVADKEDILPSPSTLNDCDDHLETSQIVLKAKILELTNLTEKLRALRAEKEPLLRVKEVLQEEIAKSNQAINAKSEELTQVKHKLRYHSERQIQDNIERLESQLRNSNYKPREEQKILDEICSLKRSFKTLKDFELKQRENKKYRSERFRLIEQRNDVFEKLKKMVMQEEVHRREMAELKEEIHMSKITIDHLKNIRPNLEKAHLEELRIKEEARRKRIDEKAKIRKEQYLKRQQERQKHWEEYEASREPYEDEKGLCRMLLGYVNSCGPSHWNCEVPSLRSSEGKSPDNVLLKSGSGLSEGVFYCKPKVEPPLEVHNSKRNKAKARRDSKANKVKGLSHPPDVIANFSKLEISLPKKTEDIPDTILSLQKKLEYFNLLGLSEQNSGDGAKFLNCGQSSTEANTTKVLVKSITSAAADAEGDPQSIFSKDLGREVSINEAQTHFGTLSSLCVSSTNSRSLFTVPLPIQSRSSSVTLTYASVTAKIGV